MTKKNLSDLLKEEASAPEASPSADAAKTAPAKTVTTQSTSASTATKTTKKTNSASSSRKASAAKKTTTKSTSARKAATKTTAAKSTATKSTATKSTTTKSTATKSAAASVPKNAGAKSAAASDPKNAGAKSTTSSASGSRSVTKADLEKQVTQLEADLKAATQREDALTKQVKGLQDDLAKQQERLFELKDALEQTQASAKEDTDKLAKVTRDLDEAKQVILKMTEAAKASAESQSVEKPAEKPAEKPSEPKPALTVKMRPGGDIYRGRRLPAHKNVPDYAIDHGEQRNHMLTNEEIGWVD